MNTRSLVGRPGRGGITINAHGDEAPLGFWPEKFDGATGHVGALRRQFGEVVRIAQRHHEQNRAAILARNTQTEPRLPEPNVRVALARADQKKLAEVQDHIAKIESAAFLAKAQLAPYDYGSDLVDAGRRQELRAHLRTMPEAARIEATARLVYRRAALEQPPELSGLRSSTHARLMEDELKNKFPEVMQTAADVAEAADVIALAMKTTHKAVSNELLAVGQPVSEPEPVAVKNWA